MKAAALDVGGTHVTAAVVDLVDGRVELGPAGRSVDSGGPAEAILAAFGGVGAALDAPAGLAWGVAMPEPFDYATGVAWFRGVGKYDSLYGVDVRAALVTALPEPSVVHFLNDADAFALGEVHAGAARGAARCLGLTLGSGIGSGWIVDGRPVSSGPGVPRDGRARHITLAGRGLEDLMSRHAIRDAYAAATGDTTADVREIAERAASGEDAATGVLRDALTALGRGLAPALRAFSPDVVVVGGSIAGSWALFEPWFRDGLGGLDVVVRLSTDSERSALLGAALSAAARSASVRSSRSGSADGSTGSASASA